MTQKPSDLTLQKKLKKASKEIINVFEKNDFDLEQCCALLGGIFASLSCQTEHRFPYLSFFYSFTNVSKEIDLSNEIEEKEIIDSN